LLIQAGSRFIILNINRLTRYY